MSVETFKQALARFINDEDFRNAAIGDPFVLPEEFPGLTRADCDSLRATARVYAVDLTKVNAVFDRADTQDPTLKGDIYCCCCCCCGSEGLVRHL